MAANKPPYMLAVGLIPKILEKVQHARRPERFTQDFLETKLGHSGGSARSIIPLLKRMNFLGSDGVPTPLYDQFRNSETQGFAVAEGMRNAFSDIFDRNEYAYDLSKEKLSGLVVEITGGTKEERTTQAIVGTFSALNEMADFEGPPPEKSISETSRLNIPLGDNNPSISENTSQTHDVDLRLSYTINLNLPETNDPDVFNAIFKSLKENLLQG